MKRLAVFLFAFLAFPAQVFAASFSDVPHTHPQYAAIESLKNLEIIKGYDDGTFQPVKAVNRVEALKMILLSADLFTAKEGQYAETGFPDVPPNAWFAAFVKDAQGRGIVRGNEDGTFAPDRQVNTVELVKMLLQAFDVDLGQHQNVSEPISPDTQIDQWYIPYLSYAKSVGVVVPLPDGRLAPNKPLTRGEVADMMYKMMILRRGGDVQKLLNVSESYLIEVLISFRQENVHAALQFSAEALFTTEQALKLRPEQGIVKAAHKIALGFRKLSLAYQADLSGDSATARRYALEAKDLAGRAYDDDPTTQQLGREIKAMANAYLDEE